MKKKKNKKTSFKYQYIILSLIIAIVALSGFLIGFMIDKKTTNNIQSYKDTILTLQQKIDKLSKELETVKKSIKSTAKTYHQNSEIIDYLEAIKNQKPKKEISINKKIKTNKPKLVIIIDDVAFKNEVQLIKSIPYKITPSFFPATKRHPNTPIYAKDFKDYMVHVPMQAIHYAHPELNTMNINWSYAKIKNRIDEIKKEFPKAKFINNHTGSKFTSNKKSMEYLFLALKEDKLGFVDSKTTPFSKSKDADKIYNIPLFQRDIFLDNIQSPTYIKNQLKKAIEIAKKRGYAIAIGHPHKVTLETIKNSKNLLNQVDVIYIDELAKYEKN